ncbi:Uncharacterised protein [Mycobacteroides abscessus subsp. abscessus]|nr:Uncharacterised protein [Mycobacteroides abscessus subsp. abscessus]
MLIELSLAPLCPGSSTTMRPAIPGAAPAVKVVGADGAATGSTVTDAAVSSAVPARPAARQKLTRTSPR